MTCCAPIRQEMAECGVITVLADMVDLQDEKQIHMDISGTVSTTRTETTGLWLWLFSVRVRRDEC